MVAACDMWLPFFCPYVWHYNDGATEEKHKLTRWSDFFCVLLWQNERDPDTNTLNGRPVTMCGPHPRGGGHPAYALLSRGGGSLAGQRPGRYLGGGYR